MQTEDNKAENQVVVVCLPATKIHVFSTAQSSSQLLMLIIHQSSTIRTFDIQRHAR